MGLEIEACTAIVQKGFSMTTWQTAIRNKIAQEVGGGAEFCVVNNTEYRDGSDGPQAQHAGELLWDYHKQTYTILNVSTDQEIADLQTEDVEEAFELLGVTNSD